MPPSAKSVATARQEKERKQKKLLLFVLLPALAIALGIQAPRLKDLLSDAQEKTASVQGDVVQGLKEVAPTVPAETAPGAVPSDPTAAVISATKGLSDTDAPPETDEGQLISFTRFDAQDPFVQLVDEESTADQGDAVPADAAPASDGTTAPVPTATPTPTTTATPTPTTTTTTTSGSTDTAGTQASISVNGSVVVVTVGQTFPENDPAFKVVAIEGNIVKVGLAGGSFSNGVNTIDLRVGDTVTLISQPDGARFQLKVVKVSV